MQVLRKQKQVHSYGVVNAADKVENLVYDIIAENISLRDGIKKVRRIMEGKWSQVAFYNGNAGSYGDCGYGILFTDVGAELAVYIA